MLSEADHMIDRDHLLLYLKDLAKEFRRLNGKTMRAELILVGGAAILAEYGFRQMTEDVDAIIRASSAIADAAAIVGDRYSLPHHWLNSDFRNTPSYSDHLIEHAKLYRTFSNILDIYTVSGEYLIAMKLMAGRQYKNDLSDIVGILSDHEQSGNPLSMDQIRKAVSDLYGSWEALPESSRLFIERIIAMGHFAVMYDEVRAKESDVSSLAERFVEKYPGAMNQENADAIIAEIQRRLESGQG